MKRNQEQVIQHIISAINAIGYDSSLLEAKKYLSAALDAVNRTSGRRTTRENWFKKFEEEGKKKQQYWMERIKQQNLETPND